jgi:DNA repair protein RecO (recombination protein O)
VRVVLQPAYLLHARKISDSRLSVDFFTQDYGVVGAIARAPSKKKSPLVLFRPAVISWQGNNSLKTLTDYELDMAPVPALVGQGLFCGFYLNELLQRLMPKEEAAPALYQLYRGCMQHFTDSAALSADILEPLLRRFELLLLAELGYAVDFFCDSDTGLSISPSAYYYLNVQQGFTCVGHAHWPCYSGAMILAIAQGQYLGTAERVAAKQITRALLAPLLGSKPLKSRELFKGLGAIRGATVAATVADIEI